MIRIKDYNLKERIKNHPITRDQFQEFLKKASKPKVKPDSKPSQT